MSLFVAVDLGASSGRLIAAEVGQGRVDVREAHRFPNHPLLLPDGLHWDIGHLFTEVLAGLAAVGHSEGPAPASVGIDAWAVDYGLLDGAGRLLGLPYHYRDARTSDDVIAAVHATVPPQELYRRNGLQFLPFNTIYQLAAESRGQGPAASGERVSAALAAAETLLLIPDLLTYWLTGQRAAEVTNASTTGLLDVRTRDWAPELARAAGIRPAILPPLASPGTVVGGLRAELAAETGLAAGTPVTAVGSHDTASAVVGVPAADDGPGWAYISCGTWSLVGLELEAPVLTEQSRAAGFTNETGVDGRVRYLHNVMGLWILQECQRVWRRAGLAASLSDLLAQAAVLPAGGPLIDPDDPRFLPPGDMPARGADVAAEAGGARPPTSPAEVVRCVLDSLAAAYARTVRAAERLSGRKVEVVHLVGGGARNALLCQLTADALGLPVLAGPAEATALGNVLVQARAHGALGGTGGQAGLDALRALVRAAAPPVRYEPTRNARG